MSRGFADRTRLAAFAARRALRTGMGRLNAHPMVRWRFTSAISDRVLIAPQDLRTADPTRASEIYAGRFIATLGFIISSRSCLRHLIFSTWTRARPMFLAHDWRPMWPAQTGSSLIEAGI